VDGLPEGPRIGVEPGVGVGFGGFTSPAPTHPGLIGFTVTQVELALELPRVGVFARAAYYSSGGEGRWIAPAFSLGASYRFFGDGETSWSLVARGAFEYERWHGFSTQSASQCSIPFFYPDNCKDYPFIDPNQRTPTVVSTVNADMFGLLAGARLELPVQSVFMALGAEVAGAPSFEFAAPGVIFHAQLSFTIAFRNHQVGNASGAHMVERARFNERGK
jgi:hypothetical protein